MKNKEFFNDVESAFYIGREIYFTIGDIEYHLDYDGTVSKEEDYVIIFNQDTGDDYYFGPKQGVYDNFIVNEKSFRTYIEEDAFDAFFIM